jgi:hypothetical protein
VLGAEHPSTLTSMGNLASTLRYLGRRQHALSLITSCADRSLAVLGVEHPDSRGYRLAETQWEKEDNLRAGEEAIRIMSDEPADGGTHMLQFPSNFSTMFFILAGFVVVFAIGWQSLFLNVLFASRRDLRVESSLSYEQCLIPQQLIFYLTSH